MRKRNIQVMLHLDSKEYQSLIKKVKKTGLSRETYLRQLITGYAPKELPPPDYHAMMRELNAIGNSINQIAARANATGFFLADEYAGNVKRLVATISTIRDAVILPERIK